MEVPLQQRIVGAIVLVTLGVIFIPALLDGSGYKSRQVQDLEVKEKPVFAPLTQKKVEPVVTPLEEIKVANEEVTKTPDSEQPQVKPIKSFALQVGTFEDSANANKLRNKLQKAGYTTFVKKVEYKGKPSYRVRIGPEIEHSVLEKIKTDLIKSHKIDGYIVNHP